MNSQTQKILNISLKVVTWLLIAFTVFMMIFTIFSVATMDKNDRSIFGIKFYIVKTDSMSLSENNKDMDVHFNAGDIIIVKEVKNFSELEPGDIITFLSFNEESRQYDTISHMIREVRKRADGTIEGYITFGTNTGVNDKTMVEPSHVLGEYTGKLPGVGHFFAFVKSTPGYIVCILVPFLLLILYNGVNVIRLFRVYKKEQTAVLEAEKAEIAAERMQNEAMMRELMALKAQLEKQSAQSPAADPAAQTDATEAASETENASENE